MGHYNLVFVQNYQEYENNGINKDSTNVGDSQFNLLKVKSVEKTENGNKISC